MEGWYLGEDSGNNRNQSKGQEDHWVLLVGGHSNASSVCGVVLSGHCGSEDGGEDDHHEGSVRRHLWLLRERDLLLNSLVSKKSKCIYFKNEKL